MDLNDYAPVWTRIAGYIRRLPRDIHVQERDDRMIELALRDLLTYALRKVHRMVNFMEDFQHPCHLPEATFRRLFGLPADLVPEVLRMISCYLSKESFDRTEVVPIYIQVLCVLNFLTMGRYCIPRNIGVFKKISEEQVMGFVRKITVALSVCAGAYIARFPTDQNRATELKNRFQECTQLPGIVGILERFHVAIVEPTFNAQEFKNMSGYHSMITQIMCDADMRVIGCQATHGGLYQTSYIYDPHIERMRELHVENPETWLLGNQPYRKEKFLIAPFKSPANEAERRFNRLYARARSRMDKCWAMLRGQWKCLLNDKPLPFTPVEAMHIIYSVCICHNLLINHGYSSRKTTLVDTTQPRSGLRKREPTYTESRDRLMKYILQNDIK
ncbi:putative nuclease HARBI1 [Phlebotomus argentipes]|uniref:putative nuclease HARBI1 n=1 Tax=Phlebotomus argentipes TaxID=94469 RepID=UPI002892E08B|nr:putative nuclease HARBI1 [Phlebotomus argentipes]XP_059621325.1 putative nuclease HARBI1 [Phlebotomus argentipes]